MTLYQIMQLLNDNMDSKNNRLRNFLLHGCEDYGSFLSTQPAKRKEPLPDRDVGNFKYVILAVRGGFKHKSIGHGIFDTPTCQLQVYWAENGHKVGRIVALNKNLGFDDCYTFPLRRINENDCT
ncbi:MAG: hypothetical protein IKK92_10420 [Prevotella sp.]|nr:hypothetical protein [Prevotella sp.]